jgi:acyl-CoA reductase-like NAD-dependent aldehyde dehydrogenase
MNKLSFFAAQAANVSGETLLKGIPGNVTTMTLKAPVGVVGGIIPWNGPLNGQFWIVGAVPASGCTTVLKPGGRVAIGAPSGGDPARGRGAGRGRRHRSGQGGRPRAGRPPDVDRIAFTGSTETERRIIEASTVNIKKLQLELGGKSADIVCADADLGKVVPGATMGAFANSGQNLLRRHLGPGAAVRRRRAHQAGAGVHRHSAGRAEPGRRRQLGPVISQPQLDKVLSYIDVGQDEGARLLRGGRRLGNELGNGYFVEPSVFGGVTNQMQISREEIFGPVLSILPFDDVGEAIAIANDSDYGLGGAVWSQTSPLPSGWSTASTPERCG